MKIEIDLGEPLYFGFSLCAMAVIGFMVGIAPYMDSDEAEDVATQIPKVISLDDNTAYGNGVLAYYAGQNGTPNRDITSFPNWWLKGWSHAKMGLAVIEGQEEIGLIAAEVGKVESEIKLEE